MPALPHFQRLPLHIAETIASYYITMSSFDDSLDLEPNGRLNAAWSIVYMLSYSWRVLSFRFFFKELNIIVSVDSGKGKLDFTCLPEHISFDASCYSFVKRVNVDFPHSRTKPYSIRPKDLSAAWPVELAFPAARSLSIDLSVMHYQEFDEHNPDENERFYWITQRIQTSMPKLQEVTLGDKRLAQMHGGLTANHRWKAEVFLSAIFGKATALNIEINTIQLASNQFFSQNSTGLTNLTCSLKSKSKLFGFVAGTSAQTLTLLDINVERLRIVRSFILDDGDKPIVYPRLETLKFSSRFNTEPDEKYRVDESVAPFPALRRLTWSSNYGFEDDTLFRGNSDTLEYLNIGVEFELASVLQRHNVFSDGKYPRLSHVSACSITVPPTPLSSIDEFMRFAVNLLSPATRHLELCYPDLSNIVDAGVTWQCFGSIQELRVSCFKGTLHALIELVRLLPRLTSIACSPGRVDFEPDSLEFKSLIDELYANYYPLGRHLRRWNVLPKGYSSLTSIMKTALALAILCPDFSVVLSCPSRRVVIEDVIKRVVECGLYSEHIDKIRGLIRMC